jgi:hypothetical protein
LSDSPQNSTLKPESTRIEHASQPIFDSFETDFHRVAVTAPLALMEALDHQLLGMPKCLVLPCFAVWLGIVKL